MKNKSPLLVAVFIICAIILLSVVVDSAIKDNKKDRLTQFQVQRLTTQVEQYKLENQILKSQHEVDKNEILKQLIDINTRQNILNYKLCTPEEQRQYSEFVF